MSTRTEDDLWMLIQKAERKIERQEKKIRRWLEEIGPLTLCADCGIDAWDFTEDDRRVHEDFYVHDTLWQATAPDDTEDGIVLCIGCFETRLGRQLNATDFKVYGARYLFGTPPSTRFIDRSSRMPQSMEDKVRG